LKKLILILLLFSVSQAQEKKLIAYYPIWFANTLSASYAPPSGIDWGGVNYVVLFDDGDNFDSTTAPYWTILTSIGQEGGDSAVYEYNWTGTNWMNQLISVVGDSGGIVLADYHAVNPTQLKGIVNDSTKTDEMALETVRYLVRKGFGGVQINIESWAVSPPPPAQISRLIRRLRAYMDSLLPTGVIMLAPGWNNANVYEVAVVNANVDWVAVQTYDPFAWRPSLNANVVWPNGALFRGTAPAEIQGKHVLGSGTYGTMQLWVDAGYNPAKLAVGIPSYPSLFTGGSSALYTTYTGGPSEVGQRFADSIATVGTETWDSDHKMSYTYGPASGTVTVGGIRGATITNGQQFVLTRYIADSLGMVLDSVFAAGYGGFMMYALDYDFFFYNAKGSGRNPLLEAAGAYMIQLAQPPDTTISFVSGSPQSGVTSAALADSFKILLVDETDTPMSGATINWAISSAPIGATGQSLSGATSNTNGSGNATILLTLGDLVGTYSVTASFAGAIGSPVVFSATATAPIVIRYIYR
jgi:hypothetical protein